MPFTLYLVRHGRTVYNTEHLMQGWCDSPLTDEGREGVRLTGKALADRRFAACFSSPSGRTLDTAGEILAHHPDVPLVRDDGLREYGFGIWEARPEAECFEDFDPPTMFAEVVSGRFPGFPEGESAADFLARIRAGFGRVEAAASEGDEVLVVSHGMTLSAWLTAVVGAPRRSLPNAGVSVVAVDGDRRTLLGHGLVPDGSGRLVPAPEEEVPGAAPTPGGGVDGNGG